MIPPENPAPRLRHKSDAELVAMVSTPAVAPEAQAAAKAELWKRMASYDHARPGKSPPSVAKPTLCSLAVYSLCLCIVPFLGLPLAVASLRRIRLSEGQLYGQKLAWASVGINAACLLFMVTSLIMTTLSSLPGK